MKTPREAFAHAITAWEGLYQDQVTDVGNFIKLADGTIFPPKNSRGQRVATHAARLAAARKPGSVVIGTMRGITPDVWAAYKRVAPEILTPQIMRGITLDDAVNVYEAFYYRGPGFDRLYWCAATEVFCDIGWGSGPAVAIKMLQRMIGEYADGVIGPRTIERFNEWWEIHEGPGAIHSIADLRCQFYRDIVRQRPSNAKFLAGWLRRANYYRPTNAAWWSTWAERAPAGVVAVQQPEAQPRPAPVTPEEEIKREADTNKIVQGGTVVGSILASLGGFLDIIPKWALGAAFLALVGVGALWALRSFGFIGKRAS